MKRVLATTFSLLITLLLSYPLQAQVNAGGTPFSYQYSLRDDNIPDRVMPQLDMEQIRKEDSLDKVQGDYPKFARTHDVNLTPSNSGSWKSLGHGDHLWRLKIKSPGAIGMNLYFENFDLPKGAKLYIYNAERDYKIGAFTASNNSATGLLATELVRGDEIIVEYYEPASVAGQGGFTINEVGHAYRYAFGIGNTHEEGVNRGFGGSDPCQVNVNCSPEGDNWQDEKRGVARIQVYDSGSIGWCSGTVINNTAQDCTPYFLTAYHCGGDLTSTDFNQWVFYFDYEASGCPDPATEPSSNTMTGASKIAGNNGPDTGSDFLLFEFNNSIPSSYNVFYNGWNRESNGGNISTSGVGIHHPSGDIKKISTYSGSLSTSGWNSSGLPTHWQTPFVTTTNGAGYLEGGSSGSPLFDNNGRVIGDLSGGTPSCAPNDGYYGKLSYSWDQNGTANADKLEPWLDPTGSGVMTLDGAYEPCAVSNPDDAGISAILSPSGTLCDTNFTPEVVIKNYGSNTLSSADINYSVDGGPVSTYNWTGSLATLGSDTVLLNSVTVSSGNHTFEAYSTLPNGNTDQDNSNDTASSSFSSISGNTITFDLQTDCYGSEVSWEIVNTSTGNIIDSVGAGTYSDQTGGSQVNNTYCVSDGCYDFNIYDEFGDGLDGANSGSCADNGDYYILDNATGDTLVDMGPDADYGTDTTHNFCVPQTQGPPTADFTANVTTVVAGGTVDFTDLSTGNPSPTSWNWTFNGAATTSSTSQNPSGIQYNNIGTYDVSLTVDNGVGTDTETKVDYIEVVSATACDTLTNISEPEDTLTYYPLSGAWGYIPGHNEYFMTKYADKHSIGTATNIRSLIVPIGLNYDGSGSSTVTFTVWGDNSGNPGTVLDQKTVPIADLNGAAYNRVDFPGGVPVGGDFYVGFEINYGAGDTVTVSTADHRPSGPNTAYAYYDDGTGGGYEWWDFNTLFGGNLNTSLGIEVLTSGDTAVADFSMSSSSICVGDTITVDGTISSNVTNYFGYNFDGGTPSSSTDSIAQVSYGSAGTFDITLYVEGGCMIDSITKQITVGGPTMDSAVTADESCGGNSDGSIDIYASGSATPFNYSIDGGSSFQSSNNFSGVSAGTYNLVVEDQNGCQTTSTATISSGTPPVIDSVATVEASCGSTDGELTVYASGGSAPYEYSIDGGSSYQSSSNFTNLGVGNYDVVVQDTSGCADTTVANISNAGGPVVDSVETTNLTCNGSGDGIIEIHATGATQYSIDGGTSFQTDSSFTGLSAGTFDVLVEDGSGCQASSQVTLTEPTPVTFTSSTTDESCGQGDGSITVNASGGNGSYQYSNDNGSTFQGSNSFTGLSAGSYDVVVKDNNGCDDTSTVVINNIAGPSIDSVNSVDVTCNGDGDGSITVYASGGTGSLQYSNDNGSTFQTSNNFSNLSGGSYDIVVEDSSGCQASTTVTINEPPVVAVDSVSTTDATCMGNDGSLTVYASGGDGNFQYSIDNGSTFQASSSFSSLSPATYDIVVEDGNGCSASTTATIGGGTGGPSISGVSTSDVTCNGDGDGSITISASNAIQYSIDGGTTFQGSNSFNGLSGGTYDIVVENSVGCQDTTTATVNEPNPITINVNVTDVTCGNSNGSISITANGGNGGFQYSIDNGANFQGSNTFSNLSKGSYGIAVEDQNGCAVYTTDSVGGTDAINVNISKTDETCQSSNGSATANAGGGTTPYSYSWTDGSGNQVGTSQSISNLSAGTYQVVVTGDNGCSNSANVNIYNTGSANATVTPSATSICVGDTLTLYGSGSGGGLTYSWTDGSGNTIGAGTTIDVSPTATSNYMLTVEDSNGCTNTDTSVVTVNTYPTTTINPSNDTSICEGESLTMSGGGGSSYYWTGGSITGDTSQTVTVSPSQGQVNYTVTASNGNCPGNSVGITVDVEKPAEADAQANDTVVALANGATVQFDGSNSVATSYQWDFGDGTPVDSSVGPSHQYGAIGTYTVVLTVGFGNCYDTDTLTVQVNQSNTGIADHNGVASNVQLYPNPTNGKLDLDVSFTENKDIQVTILSTVGKIVDRFEINKVKEERIKLDMTDEAEGIYFVNIRTDEKVIRKKIELIR